LHGRPCPAGECWLKAETLAGMSGLKPRGVEDVLARLAARDLDVRVPVVTGATGRGAYSSANRVPHYRLPKRLLTGEGHAPTGPMVTPQPDLKVTPQPDQKVDDMNDQKLDTSSLSSPSSPRSAAALAGQPQTSNDDEVRSSAELIVTAYLAYWFGSCTDYKDVIRYQQRTFRSDWQADTAAYAQYLLRCYRAAPDLMQELAELKVDDEGGLAWTDDAGPVLKEIRRAASSTRLTRANEQWCADLAAKAEEMAFDYAELDDAGGLVGPSVARCVNIGINLADNDRQKEER
jgi:hypothetical protein